MEPIGLADLLVSLSRLGDLGFGLPVGTAARSCVLSARLAESLGLAETDARAAYYTALLGHVGCLGYAHETAALFGDEFVAARAAGRTDQSSATDALVTFLPALTRGRPPWESARQALRVLSRGARWGTGFTTTACELGRVSARRLGLPEPVQQSMLHAYDRWAGGDQPGEAHGEAIPVAARVARVGGIAALFEALDGTDGAVAAVRRRAGGMVAPDVAARFDSVGTSWVAEVARLSADQLRAAVLAAEPRPRTTVPDVRAVGEMFGDLADLKSPCLAGHSRGVAALAVGAAERLRLSPQACTDLELAGLLHDVGRVAVSSAVWDKPGPLRPEEWEGVRLHAYHSERVLDGSDVLARVAPLVGRHHERLDGTGYHRGSTARDLSVSARVLAAADAYRGRTEPRPHRPAMDAARAERSLLDEVRAGAMDPDAVHAVLAAARGPSATAHHRRTDRLSGREIEVLGLVARGRSNAEIATSLGISRRTAEHHVQNVYAKIDVSCRAAATLYAVEHHLLPEDG